MLAAGHGAEAKYATAPGALTPPRYLAGAEFTRRRTPVSLGAMPAEGDLRWVGEVRREGVSTLLAWGVRSAAELDVAHVVLSELLTNALLHGTGRSIDVRLALFTGSVRFAVRSGHLHGVRIHEPDPLALDENGRGLPLVDAFTTGLQVADDWLSCSLAISSAKENA
ncbi:hypothetical protein GCM10010349_75550 [Streptomyces flavofungini]|nr:hypothetical protein GCM10010349_75550 [Streptomyces flavofungini]